MSRVSRATQRQVFKHKRDFHFSSGDYPELPAISPLPKTEMINLKEIENSSNLAAAGYCQTTGVFAVRLKNGKVYHHKDVPAERAAAFDTAESKGSFYAHEIKAHHPSELVVDAV